MTSICGCEFGDTLLYQRLTSCDASRPAVITSEAVVSWNDLKELIALQQDRLAECAGQRIGVCLSATAAGVATLAALERLGCHTFLIDGLQSQDAVCEISEQLELTRVYSPDQESELFVGQPGSRHVVAGGVTLLTSGTEGPPKAVIHSWETLAKPVRRVESGGYQTWALCYRIHLYAGLQVVLQALLNHGTLVAPGPNADPNEIASLMAQNDVDHFSATPSYTRRLLLFCDRELLRGVPLRQITMGGEVVDQVILDGVRSVFPQARLAHIYATSELGRCFSVTDGLEGFPSSFLEPEALPGVELSVKDGILHVRSSNSMLGYENQPADDISIPNESTRRWHATGDLVEVTADRVLFVGRQGDMINVGGNKVNPIQVERTIRQVEGVADVRVFGQRSSLAGELVACEVIKAGNFSEDDVRQAIALACSQNLNRYQIPRIISFTDQIAASAAGKVARS